MELHPTHEEVAEAIRYWLFKECLAYDAQKSVDLRVTFDKAGQVTVTMTDKPGAGA